MPITSRLFDTPWSRSLHPFLTSSATHPAASSLRALVSLTARLSDCDAEQAGMLTLDTARSLLDAEFALLVTGGSVTSVLGHLPAALSADRVAQLSGLPSLGDAG